MRPKQDHAAVCHHWLHQWTVHLPDDPRPLGRRHWTARGDLWSERERLLSLPIMWERYVSLIFLSRCRQSLPLLPALGARLSTRVPFP